MAEAEGFGVESESVEGIVGGAVFEIAHDGMA